MTCKVCAAKLSLGDPNSGKQLGNGAMHSHLKSFHKAESEQLQAKKVIDKMATDKRDLSDETVRGSRMVYSARTKDTRAELFNQVGQKTIYMLGSLDKYVHQVLPGYKHSVVKKWTRDSVENKSHDRAVVRMLVIDVLPLHLVSKSGFLLYTAQTSPKYEVKSEPYYRGLIDQVRLSHGRIQSPSSMVLQIYQLGIEKLKKKIKDDAPITIYVALDAWSRQHHGYMGVIFGEPTPFKLFDFV